MRSLLKKGESSEGEESLGREREDGKRRLELMKVMSCTGRHGDDCEEGEGDCFGVLASSKVFSGQRLE